MSYYHGIMDLGFDLISDLNITDISQFDWEGKPTSLYCILPGNISTDLNVVHQVLQHLSQYYQGIFYIDGRLENPSLNDRAFVIEKINEMVASVPNLVYLHNNVVVIEGVAVVGVNGWSQYDVTTDDDKFQLKSYKYDDLAYLQKTIEKLQLHMDVKKIVIISNSVPSIDLYFGEFPYSEHPEIDLDFILDSDTENKIKYWAFGSHKKIVDTNRYGINYLNNPKYENLPYYAKRISI